MGFMQGRRELTPAPIPSGVRRQVKVGYNWGWISKADGTYISVQI